MVELMITLVVLAAVAASLMVILYAASRSRTGTVNRVESTQSARTAIDMMSRDLRSAGFGIDSYASPAQTPIAYIDSLQVLLNANLDPYPDGGTSGPRAYDPTASPRPFPLNGTAWQPPMKFRTGAEVVRWTLDANNDGVINATDIALTAAERTRNPDDYMLIRQVYGDSTANAAGNNGGALQNVALVSKPGGTVPAMFMVYMKDSNVPWNWSNGPVPAAQLNHIERIVLNVTAPSGKPDSRQQYASTRLTTEVNSMRNTPDFGQDLFTVDGFVWNDDGDGVRQVGEPGIPGQTLRLGNAYIAYTNATGYFQFRAPAGAYSLKHAPTSAYQAVTTPDSFVVTIGPGTTRSFADRPRPGGWAHIHVFDDTDANGSQDPGEPDLPGISLRLDPGAATGFTNGNGNDSLFAGVGSYTVTATLPDSFLATTPNPVTGTMIDGGTASHVIGLSRTAVGTISGNVFQDFDRDGVKDAGDTGKGLVWVGVSPDGGLTLAGYTTTNASGDFSLTVPANNPPGTEPYQVYIVVPPGFFPTTTTSRGPILLSAGQVITGQNFGLDGFQKISLSAQRVLSLGSGDLIEKDWTGNSVSKRGGDADLVLGADNLSTDQVSVWYNQYDATPLFLSTRDHFRAAAQAVTSLSVNKMDEGVANFQGERNDLVTGTRYAPAGNLFVWFMQNSSGNEGKLPASPDRSYTTPDLGDVQSVLTADVSGLLPAADARDILVGTKSPTAWTGNVYLYQSSGGGSPLPTYTRVESYPQLGDLYSMGEVASMALADLDNDGDKDLVVGTRTGTYRGQVLIYRNLGKTSLPRFQYVETVDLPSDMVNAVVCVDVDHDGYRDVVAGTTRNISSGKLVFIHNENPSLLDFQVRKYSNAPGPVQSLGVGDFGGDPTHEDVALGWRADVGSYSGGLRIFYTDTGNVPDDGVDPLPSDIINWVAAITVNNFNWGLYPSWAGTPLTDLAIGVKSSATEGAIWILVR
jgi:type II secretory pathway pseudopilin PulG